MSATGEDPVVTPVEPASAKQTSTKAPKRPVLVRLFGLSVWGGFKLAVVCVLVGFFLLALEFNPASNDVNVFGAMSQLIQNLAGAAIWALRNFWKPLLAGASVVLPLWVLWRLLSLPFRK